MIISNRITLISHDLGLGEFICLALGTRINAYSGNKRKKDDCKVTQLLFVPRPTLRVSKLVCKITNLRKFRLSQSSESGEKNPEKPTLVSARFAVS